MDLNIGSYFGRSILLGLVPKIYNLSIILGVISKNPYFILGLIPKKHDLSWAIFLEIHSKFILGVLLTTIRLYVSR